MRNLILIFFSLVTVKLFSQELVILRDFQKPRQINIFRDMLSQSINMKCIVGDFWHKFNDIGSAASFDNYYFYSDATFKRESGYSGGIYMLSIWEGKYTIDEKNNAIKLKVKRVSGNGYITPTKTPKNMSLKIVGINDTIIAIESKNKESFDTIIYYRVPGCMKAQTWKYAKKYTEEYQNGAKEVGENDWEHSIEFHDFGQFAYTVTNTWQNYKKFTFVGSYHLHKNIIYLKIRSKSTYNTDLGINEVQQFKPEKQAYIRVDIEKMKVNLSDLEDLINCNIKEKCWSYSNCVFKTEQPILDSVNDEWIVMSLIK